MSDLQLKKMVYTCNRINNSRNHESHKFQNYKINKLPKKGEQKHTENTSREGEVVFYDEFRKNIATSF